MVRAAIASAVAVESSSDDELESEDETEPLVRSAAVPRDRSIAAGYHLSAIWCLLLWLVWDTLRDRGAVEEVPVALEQPRLAPPRVEPRAPAQAVRPPPSTAVAAASPPSAASRGAAATPRAAAVAVARSNGSGSASCPPAWVGDGVCQLSCAAEAHGDKGDCRAPAAECDAQVGLGYLASVRRAREPMCEGGPSRAWLHVVPDQGCRCDTCRTKLAVLEGARLEWDARGGAEPKKKRAQGVRQACLSARLACADGAGRLGRLTPSDRGYGLALQSQREKTGVGNRTISSAKDQEVKILVIHNLAFAGVTHTPSLPDSALSSL